MQIGFSLCAYTALVDVLTDVDFSASSSRRDTSKIAPALKPSKRGRYAFDIQAEKLTEASDTGKKE